MPAAQEHKNYHTLAKNARRLTNCIESNQQDACGAMKMSNKVFTRVARKLTTPVNVDRADQLGLLSLARQHYQAC
jgi:ABC-type xylose transport system substrate-binding protein